MRIGMTYDLREDYLALGYGEEETAEFDKPDTIDAIEGALRSLGHETDRIGNAGSLMARLSAGERWDMVFNIAEGLHGFGREALVPALLDAHRISYTFSDPLVLALTLHKGMAKRVMRDLSIPTPDFAVVERPEDAGRVSLPFPLFAKPVAEGTGKGISAASMISSPIQLDVVCREMLETYRQPVLVETFLPGREFTVGILGTGPDAVPLGAMEVMLKSNAEQGVYSYTNKEDYQDRVEYRWADDDLARRTIGVALAAYRGLGCRDGGRVDLRTDDRGVPNFIEVNPLAGIHPIHSDLCIIARMAGMDYQELIAAILNSAVARKETERQDHEPIHHRYPFQPALVRRPGELGGFGRYPQPSGGH